MISADTVVAYLACLSMSVRRPFPSHGGGKLCLSVVRFPRRGGIQQRCENTQDLELQSAY